ncbi:unnamed protein product [Didymodactylos carnosus]|uniref:Microbial-type PARG catalytic domain-containing protein n=1 Tax=Didymodactylos carnosus TaxID=1234261 RepID=A0A814RYX1_9BILA|nr:unnamed protein product [Didymodactylos carnosus]CAF3902025.1 unnamed protein product [Didymodactylos carnosus]
MNVRYCNIDPENRKLPPAYDYLSSPLVSLEISLEKVIPLIDNLQHYTEIAIQHCHSSDRLTQAESAALHLYTMEWGDRSFYHIFNNALQDANRAALKPWSPYLKPLDTALKNLPSTKLILQCAVHAEVSRSFKHGQLLAWWSLNPCSSSFNVIKDFLGPDSTLFMIEAANGKSISSYTCHVNENEFVLMPGTRLKVVKLQYDEKNINNLSIVSTTGECYYQIEQYEQAIEYYRTSLEIMEDNNLENNHDIGLKSIPKRLSKEELINHKQFKNCVKTIDIIGENAIIELNDKIVWEECLKTGSLRIHYIIRHITLEITPYTKIIDPDNSPITFENWYGNRMLDYKPDIMQFDFKKDQIFRYRWNSKIWLEQFHNIDSYSENLKNNDQYTSLSIRHMLRVTVMLNTMAAVKNGKYILEDGKTIIPFKFDTKQRQKIKTILYNHQSKLIDSNQEITIQIPFKSTNIHVNNEDCLISYAKLISNGLKPVLLNMANSIIPGGGYRKGDGAQEENIFRRTNYYISLDYSLDQNIPYIQHKRSKCDSNGKLESMSNTMYPIDEFGAIYAIYGTGHQSLFFQIDIILHL